jgi:hypothetical protein
MSDFPFQQLPQNDLLHPVHSTSGLTKQNKQGLGQYKHILVPPGSYVLCKDFSE